MTEQNNLPRVYGEKEIGRILKRATELQHDEPTAPSAAGMTLAELEEVALEAGIDPAFLQRAAREVDTGVSDDSPWRAFVGDDIRVIRETTLIGDMGDDGFERVVAVIQAHGRLHGTPSLLGRTLTWQADSPGSARTVQIVVTSRDGTTQVRLEENLGQVAAGLFTGMTTGFGFGLGLPAGIATGSVAAGIAVPVGVTALSYMASRWIYRAIVDRRRKALNQLFERIVSEAQASIDRATFPAPQGNEPPPALPSR